MKRYATAVSMFLLLVFAAAASGPAMAQHFRHDHGGVRLGISLGVPLYWPGYYPGPYYSYPAYAYPAPAYAYPGPLYAYPGSAAAPSGAYIEQNVPQAAPAPAQPQGDWYYCVNSNAYYPYVRDCPDGWQRVPSTPPSR